MNISPYNHFTGDIICLTNLKQIIEKNSNSILLSSMQTCPLNPINIIDLLKQTIFRSSSISVGDSHSKIRGCFCSGCIREEQRTGKKQELTPLKAFQLLDVLVIY